MRTKDVRTIQEFGKFIPAYAACERNRLSLYREAAKEAEDIIDPVSYTHLAIKGGKITAEVLKKALAKFIEEIENAEMCIRDSPWNCTNKSYKIVRMLCDRVGVIKWLMLKNALILNIKFKE